MRSVQGSCALTAGAVCAVAGILLLGTAPVVRAQASGSVVPAAPPAEQAVTPAQVPALWRDLAADLGPTAAACQRLLLGDRDPNGTSCVNPESGTELLARPTGGVGTSLVAVCLAGLPERSSPTADFVWHQTKFKTALETLRAKNQVLLPKALRLASQSEQLARALGGLTAWPQGFAASGTNPGRDWVGYCAGAFDAAVAQQDLAACKAWADELAAAAFALADLHRWVDFLLENHLTAIAFQDRCKALFEACDTPYADKYDATLHPTFFPAGRLTLNGPHNLMEVEHQAEWLFRAPDAYLESATDGAVRVKRAAVAAGPAAVWMPPTLRETFARLREVLSSANQAVWDRAAHSPFHRTYLVNMLYRASRVGVVDELAVVLKRFDHVRPQSDPAALMDVLFYRGGDLGAGILWGDRFHPHLMSAAGALGGSDEQVLLGAQHFTRAVFDGWEHYAKTPTLHEALLQKRLDCIRATDMVGSLYRNAGRAGYYTVRWSAGMTGYTAAAAEVPRSGGPAIVVVDGLESPQTTAELWPHAYTRGPTWPTGYTGIKATVHSAELFTRGLDDYVWVEGYVLRGPHAGTLLRASVPYVPNRPPPGTFRSQIAQSRLLAAR